MRILLSSLLLLVVSPMFCAQEAQAQSIYGYTSISYDADRETVRGYSATSLDFDTQFYYRAEVNLKLTDENGATLAENYAVDHLGRGFVSLTLERYAPSGWEFKATGSHYAWAELYDYSMQHQRYAFWDYFNFGYFASQFILVPHSYEFIGPGPIVYRNYSQLKVGDTYGTVSLRDPHHLKVVFDGWGPLTDCPSTIARVMTFRVVNVRGGSVGTVRVREVYLELSQNSCGNGQPNADGCADTDGTNGEFTDNISVRCNSTGGNCGYDIKWQWQWCRSNGTPVPLGTLNGQVRNNAVTVNGVTTPEGIPPGTAIKP